MTEPTTHKTPATAAPSGGRVGRWLADLGLGYVLMLCASIGGLVWLVAIHLLGMVHDAALILSLTTGAGAFIRAHRLATRAVAARHPTNSHTTNSHATDSHATDSKEGA